MINPFDQGYLTENELAAAGFKSIGENVKISKTCNIVGLSNIEIGSNVRIDAYTSIIAAGDGFARFGSFIHIAGYCGIYAGHGVTMEDFSGLSAGVKVYSGTDDYSGRFMTNPTVPAKYTNVKSGHVQLRRHVIIGTGSIVLPSVIANEGAAVGALSLINKNLDAWAVYAGTPVRKLRERHRDLLALEEALRSETS